MAVLSLTGAGFAVVLFWEIIEKWIYNFLKIKRS